MGPGCLDSPSQGRSQDFVFGGNLQRGQCTPSPKTSLWGPLRIGIVPSGKKGPLRLEMGPLKRERALSGLSVVIRNTKRALSVLRWAFSGMKGPFQACEWSTETQKGPSQA